MKVRELLDSIKTQMDGNAEVMCMVWCTNCPGPCEHDRKVPVYWAYKHVITGPNFELVIEPDNGSGD